MFNAWIHTSGKDSPGGRRCDTLVVNLYICVCVLSFCRGWACGLWWFLRANGAEDAGWDGSHGRTEGAPLRLQTGKRSPARHCEVRLQVSVKGPDTMTVLWSVQQDVSLERAKSAWLTLVNKSEGRRGAGAECRRKMFQGGRKIFILMFFMSLPPCHLSHPLIHARYTDDFVWDFAAPHRSAGNIY